MKYKIFFSQLCKKQLSTKQIGQVVSRLVTDCWWLVGWLPSCVKPRRFMVPIHVVDPPEAIHNVFTKSLHLWARNTNLNYTLSFKICLVCLILIFQVQIGSFYPITLVLVIMFVFISVTMQFAHMGQKMWILVSLSIIFHYWIHEAAVKQVVELANCLLAQVVLCITKNLICTKVTNRVP